MDWEFMGRIAVYTCIIGSYDELAQPCIGGGEAPAILGNSSGIKLTPQDDVCEYGVDFICFVGHGEKTAERVGVWQIRELPQSALRSCRSRSRFGAAWEKSEAASSGATPDASENSGLSRASDGLGASEAFSGATAVKASSDAIGITSDAADGLGAAEVSSGNAAADAPLLSRYPKMHPHKLLPGYEASLWIDGNIAITGPQLFDALRSTFESGVLYAGVPHPARDCVYAEARKCRDMRYLSNLGLLRVWAWLALHGEKRHGGLMENNLIFRRHCEPAVVRMDELWWNCVRKLCRRDQISLMWCLRRCGIERKYLLGAGLNSRNFPSLRYNLHTK